MEISKAFFLESLLPLFKSRTTLGSRAQDTKHEVEASVLARGAKGQPTAVDRAAFMHLLSNLLSRDEYVQQETQDSLDVQADGVRVTIRGSDPISRFCKTSRFELEHSEIIRKNRTGRPVLMDEYPLKIRSSTESAVGNGRAALRNMGSATKLFRLKKRMSFMMRDNAAVRLDLTVVKQMSAASLLESGVQQARESYEIEVEYVGEYDAANDGECQRACSDLLRGCAGVLEIMAGGWGVVPSTNALNRAFSEYLETIDKRADSAERTMFVGPQPVTLERRHLCQPGPGVFSVLKDYTVTDKADGLRMLMFVASDGLAYMMDSKLNVVPTGIRVGEAYAKTLIDGEYVTHTRLGPGARLFMAFDIYYDKGRDVRSLPLATESASVENRLDALQLFIASVPDNDRMSIRCKAFYCDSAKLLESCKKILIEGNLHSKLKDDTLPYYIDGLIFTPRDLSVGGLFPGDTPRDGTWPLTFKWKPPQYNSIDFKVEIDKSDFVVREDAKHGTQVFKVGTLLVGATDDGAGGSIGYLDPLSTRHPKQSNVPGQGGKGRYILRSFNPVVSPADHVDRCHLLVDAQAAGGTIRCENGDVIEDGAIVEFRYEISEPVAVPFRWKPMRVRHDKVRPNFSTIAASNWKSIQFPVTEGMVCGDDMVVEDEVLDDDAYYLRLYSRDKSATKPMLHFHNHWVKDACMLKRVAALTEGRISSVLDIACGKGNDLPRWLKYKVERVVGVDIVEENILNAEDGAYARVRGSRNRGDLRHVFVTMDASKTIDSTTINQIEQPSLREIARAAWGIERTERTEDIFGIAVDKFQLVTCNFAVHYFFDKEASLKAFAGNVARHLAKGGHFIGTCFDKARIERLLRTVPVGKEASAEKNGRTIWSIARLYGDSAGEFGAKIAVYIETIGRKNVEYLVDFERLKLELSALGVVLTSTGTFDQSYDELASSPANVRSNKYFDGPDGALRMSDAEKQLSFLNRWFVFQKPT